MGPQAIARVARAPLRRSAEPVSQPASLNARVDDRPKAVGLRNLSDAMHAGSHITAQRALADILQDSPAVTSQLALTEAINGGPHAASQRRLSDSIAAAPASEVEQARPIAPAGSHSVTVATKTAGSGVVQAQPHKKLLDIIYKSGSAKSLGNKIKKGFDWMTGNVAADVQRIDPNILTTLYRVDPRPPKVILNEGFKKQIWNKNRKLNEMKKITKREVRRYQVNNTLNPGIISTSDSPFSVKKFGDDKLKVHPNLKLYYYGIDGRNLREIPQKGNIPLLQQLIYSDQSERMILDDIDPSRVTHIKNIYDMI